MKEVKINTDMIKLDQLLKWAGIAASGAEAKEMVLSGIVKLNGDVILQRGKKVYRGDKVSVEGAEDITVI